MKKHYYIFVALVFFTNVNSQILNFSDINFKARLLASRTFNDIAKDANNVSVKIDANANGEIEVNEISNVYALDLDSGSSTPYYSYKISSLNGISNFTTLKSLKCPNNLLSNLDLSVFSNLTFLNCNQNNLTTLNITGLSNLDSLYCQSNQLTSLNLTGLVNLKLLNCGYNQFSTLNTSDLHSLQYFDCINNHISSLNVNNLLNLDTFYCGNNNLTALNVSGLVNLKQLSFGGNQIANINLSGLINLQIFICNNNLLTSLDVSNLPNLVTLDCYNNQLTSLNITGTTKISTLYCQYNNFSSLDFSSLSLLSGLICSANPSLTSLSIKNGHSSNGYNFSQNSNLRYICADEIQISDVQNKIVSYGYTNCHVNSYCSFVPGGTFYKIIGNAKYDVSANGCDASDINLANGKYTISNGTLTGAVIGNTSGYYSMPVQAGTYTVTPVFENPSYFTASPINVAVTFPTQPSPFTQNFCITANGFHPDLEVSILPINAARPGVNVQYKLIYKNKGNTTQSGTVNITFNDTILDLVSSNPVAISSVNSLSWNFSNLSPLEVREIVIILNVNSSSETPAVNAGDVLHYNVTISSVAADEMPSDNTFTLNQLVVNSFDPNDKMCLEGITIAPEKVGDYVHYMIRFENNGTANAQNIVVKDMIDTNKFDINSLVPIKGSHSFVTNITQGNKVEFIFENINLPFDDANNDGYVAFKIKTKPTLVAGDTFANNASIYFDYNFPIATNTATTTIQALSRQDFEFSTYFNLYPNPVHDVLTIVTKENIEISSVNIYNTLGQLVLVIPNAQNTKTVDVSSLKTGHYFIKINSDKGTSNTKFTKE